MGLFDKLYKLIRPTWTTSPAEKDAWPIKPGRYAVVAADAPIVVTTLASESLAADLAGLAPQGLCMVAAVESSRDVKNLICNLAANLSIQCLVVAGKDNADKPFGAALLALLSATPPGERTAAICQPIRSALENEISTLRERVKLVDLIGSEDVHKVLSRIGPLAADAKRPNTGIVVKGSGAEEGVERVMAGKSASYELNPDKAGEFRIKIERGVIVLQHYGQKDNLLRIVEGDSARDICLTLIRNGWVSKLDHAAYLGRQLTWAELALRDGTTFVQDADLLVER